MNRYQEIKKQVYQILNKECFGKWQREGLEHLFSVAALANYLAVLRGLNSELAATIGLLHDIAVYKLASHFDHANRSSLLAHDVLVACNLFTNDEIELMVNAIKNHSNKDQIDDVYSELIKDADLLAQYLSEPEACLNKTAQQRIDKLLPKDE